MTTNQSPRSPAGLVLVCLRSYGSGYVANKTSSASTLNGLGVYSFKAEPFNGCLAAWGCEGICIVEDRAWL